MARTAQDLIDQAKLKEKLEAKEESAERKAYAKAVRGRITEQQKETKERIRAEKATKKLFETAKKGIKAEERTLKKGIKRGFTAKPSSQTRALDKKVSVIARKAIQLVSPKGSLAQRLTYASEKGKSKGRGRPTGTFKTRYLPSGKAVKVPTHIYKKMLSAEKTQMRLAQAQRQAEMQMQAEQMAMQQDPRYQQGSEEQFLGETDQVHEMNVAQAQQEAEMYPQEPQRPIQQGKVTTFIQNFGRGVSRIGGAVGARRPMQVDQYGREVQQPSQISLFGGPGQGVPPQRSQVGRLANGGVRGSPRVTAISTKANLLNISRNNKRRYR